MQVFSVIGEIKSFWIINGAEMKSDSVGSQFSFCNLHWIAQEVHSKRKQKISAVVLSFLKFSTLE